MKAFATLLDRLVLTPSRNGKLKLMTDYFRETPDPDRGYGLAAIAGTLKVQNVKPAMLRDLVLEQMDEVLFRYSYDYVGDLAETISLVWDRESEIDRAPGTAPKLGEVVRRMNALGRTEVRGYVRELLDQLDASGRFAFLKLATGALRIGVSARLAKQALAELSGKDVAEIETLWHGLQPPYESLFAWLEGEGDKPVLATPAIFHSVMLAHPVEAGAWTISTPPTMPPNGNGTASAFSCRAPATCAGSIRVPATTFPGLFPISSRRSASRASSTASF